MITLLSVIASLLLTTLSLWAFSVPPSVWPTVQLIGTLIPLLLATIVGVVTMRLIHALDEAREQVHRLAMIDGLTGVLNRSRFMEMAELEFNKASRFGLELSVLMMDADLFKHVNDVHGHATGDGVLCGMTRAVTASLRDCDILGRYGGEEFVALLPLTDAASAIVAAQRVRTAVAALHFDGDAGETFQVTVSVGIGVFDRGITSLGALLNDADKALYRAKANGRNRVETSADRPALSRQ